MKRLYILLACMLCVAIAGFAKKEYVHLYVENPNGRYANAYLTGNIPANMQSNYYVYEQVSLGDILNLLSDNGFSIEHMSLSPKGTDNTPVEAIILSRTAAEQGAIEIVPSDNGEAVEVARYNMQGLPVNENEKGVQIVVYSNFTAKVVIVQ